MGIELVESLSDIRPSELSAGSFSEQYSGFPIGWFLQEGIYIASETEVIFRFGAENRQRRGLVLRVRRWIELARQIGTLRLFFDGSFAVVLLPPDFNDQIARNDDAAIEFEEMLVTRRPEEIFAAEDEIDSIEWVDFFSQTRKSDSESLMVAGRGWWR